MSRILVETPERRFYVRFDETKGSEWKVSANDDVVDAWPITMEEIRRAVQPVQP